MAGIFYLNHRTLSQDELPRFLCSGCDQGRTCDLRRDGDFEKRFTRIPREIQFTWKDDFGDFYPEFKDQDHLEAHLFIFAEARYPRLRDNCFDGMDFCDFYNDLFLRSGAYRTSEQWKHTRGSACIFWSCESAFYYNIAKPPVFGGRYERQGKTPRWLRECGVSQFVMRFRAAGPSKRSVKELIAKQILKLISTLENITFTFELQGIDLSQISLPTETFQDEVYDLSYLFSEVCYEFQMMDENESEQGAVAQDSEKASNTIVTRDHAEEKTVDEERICNLSHICSSEPPFVLTQYTDRFIPLDSLTIKLGDNSNSAGELIQVYNFPEAFQLLRTTNPAHSFMLNALYGEFLSVEFKLVVTSQRFNNGKIIASLLHTPYQDVENYLSLNAAFVRQHIILDLASLNQGIIAASQQYAYPFCLLHFSDNLPHAVRPRVAMALIIQTLSPFNCQTGNPSELSLRVFVRLRKVHLHGMTYETQMDYNDDFEFQIDITVRTIVESGVSILSLLLGNPLPAARQLFSLVDTRIAQFGQTVLSLDKPVDTTYTAIVPTPRAYFNSGKGLSDANVLKLNPTAATSYANNSLLSREPVSFYEFARIWGLFGSFIIKQSQKSGEKLGRLVLDPTWRHSSIDNLIFSLTPFEYAAQYYMFRHGSIELRFDFVCTMFHSCLIQIAIEILQSSKAGDEDVISTYVTVIELGDQKSFTITTPYIIQNQAERSTVAFGHPWKEIPTEKKELAKGLAIGFEPRMWLVPTIINPLRCAESTSTAIECLVFWRCGENYTLYGLKPSTHTSTFTAVSMKNFPQDGFYESPTKNANRTQWREAKWKSIKETLQYSEEQRKEELLSARSRMSIKRRLPAARWLKSEYASARLKAYNLADRQKKVKELFAQQPSLVPRDLKSTSSHVELSEDDGWSDDELPIIVEATRQPMTTQEPVKATTTTVAQNMTTPDDPSAPPKGTMTYWDAARVKFYNEKSPNFSVHYLDGKPVEVPDALSYVKDGRYAKWKTNAPWVFDRLQRIWMTWREYQMDTKEDVDETATFKQSNMAYTAITSDFQTAFYDILKQPVLVVDNLTVLPISSLTKGDTEMRGNCGFFIPIQPPSFNMIPPSLRRPNAIWSTTVYQSPHAGIINLFRVSKGEHRYTFIFKRIGEISFPDVIYIYYLPHSGVRILGNHSLGSDSKNISWKRWPIWGAGFRMTICCPSINNTVTVEVGGETENTWTLNHESYVNENYTWRDKGNTNQGHIVVVSDKEVAMDVFWAAGNSFRCAGLMGVPYQTPTGYADILHETNQVTGLVPVTVKGNANPSYYEPQINFSTKPLRNAIRDAGDSLTQTLMGITQGTEELVSTVKTASSLITGDTGRVSMAALETCISAKKFLDKLNGETDDIVVTVMSMIREHVDTMAKALRLTVTTAEVIYDMFLDLIAAWYNKSWFNVAIGVFRLITKLILTKVNVDVIPFATKFMRIFERREGQSGNQDSFTKDIVALLVAFVGTVIGVTIDGRRTIGVFSGVFQRVTSTQGIAFFNHVLRFVHQIFETVVKLIRIAFNQVNSHADILSELQKNSAEIDMFVMDAQEIVSEANSSLFKNPSYRVRVLRCLFQALQFQRMIVQLPNNKVSPVLGQLCSQVVRYCNDHWDALSACPVRREPFIIMVEGEPGIGKSHSVERLVESLLKSIEYSLPTSGLIYYRTPGEKWWSGFSDQFAVCYDEWFNLNDREACVKIVSELFKLKSPALFIPEQAEISRKEQHANPLVVVINCNSAFPGKLNEFTLHPDAVMRRRDMVVRITIKPEFKGKTLDDPSLKLTENCEHLMVQLYENPRSESKLLDPIPYVDFLKYAGNAFKIFHARESKKVQVRLERYMEMSGTQGLKIQDPFSLYYQQPQHQQNLLPSLGTPFNQLKDSIEELKFCIEQHQKSKFTFTEPEKMNWQDLVQQEERKEDSRVEMTDELVDITPVTVEAEVHWEVQSGTRAFECTSCHEISQYGAGCKNGHNYCASQCFTRFPPSLNQHCYYCKEMIHIKNVENLVDLVNGKGDDMATILLKLKQKKGQLDLHPWNDTDYISAQNFVTFAIMDWGNQLIVDLGARWRQIPQEIVKQTERVKNRLKCCHVSGMFSMLDETPVVYTKEGDVVEIQFEKCGPHCNATLEYWKDLLLKLRNQGHKTVRGISLYFQTKFDCSDIWNEMFSKSKWFNVYTVLLGLSGVCLTVYGITRFFSSSQEAQGHYNANRARQRRVERQRTAEAMSKPWLNVRAEHQSLIYPEVKQVDLQTAINNKIRKNMITFWLQTEKGEVTAHAIGLIEHYLCIPKHSFEYLFNNQYKGLTFAPSLQQHQRKEICLDKDNAIYVPDYDIVFYKMPSSCKLFAKIIQYFVTEEDMNKPLPHTGQLLAHPTDDDMVCRQIEVTFKKYERAMKIRDKHQNTSILNAESLVYNYSEKGICGAVLSLPKTQRPLCGVHYAGSQGAYAYTGEGMAVIITQDMINHFIKVYIQDVEPVVCDPLDEGTLVLPIEVQVDYSGKLPDKLVPFIPHKSKLVKSCVYGYDGLTSNKHPAILSRHDKRYQFEEGPLIAGVSKHGLLTKNFPTEVLDMAFEGLWDNLFVSMRPLILEPRKLTRKQAVIGLDHEAYPGMELDKSAGYPWILTTKKSKKHYIEIVRCSESKDNWVVKMNSDLINRLDKCEEMLENGIVPAWIFVDTLKDEKRKQTKLESFGGTRVFCSGPQDMVVLYRQYTQHFVTAFMHNRHQLMHAVGCNPLSEEWTRIAEHLFSNGEDWSTIDYSNFGPGFNVLVCERAHALVASWLQKYCGFPFDKMMTLFYPCIQSVHIVHNLVYTQLAGSPSGAPLTTVINTIVNLMYLLCAWIILMEKVLSPELIVVKFFEKLALYTYGDDGIFSISEELREYYNSQTVSELFALYNICSTTADKGNEVVPTEKWYECVFLKRKFLPHDTRPGMYLSPLDLDSLKSITQYVWESPNLMISTFGNCEAAVLQAHGHGKQFFNEFKDHVNHALVAQGIQPVGLQWRSIDAKFFGSGIDTEQL